MTSRPPPVTRSYSSPEEHTSATSPDFLIKRNSPSSTHGKSHPNTNNGKMVAIKVQLLDDGVTIIQAQSKTLGRLIFTQICKQLNVLEADYFGLEYVDGDGVGHWLDLEKRLSRQVGLSLCEPMLKFSVKFYTPDPSQLEEEFTRYLFSLQIKRDLSGGVLSCNDNTAALMASFIVQAECGDFSEEDYADASYLSVYKFVPHQNYELERKIRECHKKHVGQSPAEADLHLLETARRTEMYGIRLHPARDEDGVQLTLSVCHMGVLVFQNNSKINTFSWAKIRKISFKRKRFILKLHPESYFQEGYYKELVEFIFDSRNECKAYWKRCVEHHAFFRCEKAPNPIHRSKGILSSRGSSFRYSGRTQKQMVQFVRENFTKRPPTGGGGQYLSQQNLSTFESQGGSGGRGGMMQMQQNNKDAEFQRSSSFKKYSPPKQLPPSTRRSTGNMLELTTPSTTPHHNHQPNANPNQNEDDDEEDEEFSDYHCDGPPPPTTAQHLPHPSHHQKSTSPPSSITSSPLQQQHPHPAHPPHIHSTEGNVDNLSDLEQQLLTQLAQPDSDELSSISNTSKLAKVIYPSQLNEFPVTSYKTVSKLAPPPAKIGSKKRLRKIRSKSMQHKKSNRNDSDEEVHSSLHSLNSASKKRPASKKQKEDSSQDGSYDLLESSGVQKKLTFEEVDIPYLLRRRIDFDSGKGKRAGSDLGGKVGLGKSKSCSSYGRGGSMTGWSEGGASGRYCSLGELPGRWSFGWRDDSLERLGFEGGGWGSTKEEFVLEPKLEQPEKEKENKEELTLIQEEPSSSTESNSTKLSLVAERVVDEVIEQACEQDQQRIEHKKLDRRDSFQKMQSLDGIEELPLDDVTVLEIMNEIIDEENDENLEVEQEAVPEEEAVEECVSESSITPKIIEQDDDLPPPPPTRTNAQQDNYQQDYDISTPRYPPPTNTPPIGDASFGRRSSYDSSVEPPTNLLKKALLRSFSIDENLPLPLPPTILEEMEVDFDFIDKSEPLYDTIPPEPEPTNPHATASRGYVVDGEDSTDSTNPPAILYKTRFRTLSRISEFSSCNESRQSTLMDAPLVTLTSELGDSSATLNDLEDIENEEFSLESGGGGYFVEGVVLGQVQEAVVVNPEEEEEAEEASFSSNCTSTVMKKQRVCIELRVFGALYYSSKLLLNYYRTYLKDLTLISTHPLLTQLAHPLLTATTLLTPIFATQIQNLPKYSWEIKHGAELKYRLKSHFKQNSMHYKAYFNFVGANYGEICSGDESNYYIGMCCLVLKVWWWVEYCGGFCGGEEELVSYRALMGNMLDVGKAEEIKRDVVGILGKLEVSKFLRQGVLLKLNRKKGLQGRIVFLFTNTFIYCTRISSSQGFLLHGLIPTSAMELGGGGGSGEEGVAGIPHSFMIGVSSGGEGEKSTKILVLATFSEEEKSSWLSSLRFAISNSTPPTNNLNIAPTSSSNSSIGSGTEQPILPQTKPAQSWRPNLPSHVVYHRNLSISAEFILASYSKNLSSYLLRKFKSSPGWQRLWVVYCNLCLYFYKSHEADVPLASLPLLGYKVELGGGGGEGEENEEGAVGKKEHVFKLGFKNHVYYFRAESGCVWGEWVRVLGGLGRV